jgi:hypothetical protein
VIELILGAVIGFAFDTEYVNTSRGAATRPHANTFFNNIAWRKIAALPKANNARSHNKSTSTDLRLLPRVGYTPTDSGGREKAPANGAGVSCNVDAAYSGRMSPVMSVSRTMW